MGFELIKSQKYSYSSTSKCTFAELPSSTELLYFIRKSVINTEVRIPVIKYGNMKIQTCVYIAATVANILHALRASFNS